MDPLILEARRFYDVVKIPRMADAAGELSRSLHGRDDAHAADGAAELRHLEDGVRLLACGSRANRWIDYRQRTGVVTYYNKNELGLGRELCLRRVRRRHRPQRDRRSRAVACYVTNYGSVFRDQVNSLAEAVEGKYPRNTVAITWRPSMEPGYEVQFYVYGPDGTRLDYAQLDTHGPRPVPARVHELPRRLSTTTGSTWRSSPASCRWTPAWWCSRPARTCRTR